MALYLVDASPYIFRAYFALPELTDPAGNPVQAVRGFLDFLVRLVKEEQPTHLAAAFDKSLTTSFRNDILPAYKAQRPLPPPELEAQLDACAEAASAFGAATFADPRYEADDLIATLLAGWSDRAVVVTNDKDLAQLVTDRVAWLDFAKGDRYGPAEVEAKFGVPPACIPDLLGLAGDPVDGIPGIKGVGPKSAVALLSAFGSLEAIYERIGEVDALPIRGAKSLRRKLEEGREAALLSKRLATVATDAPVGEPDLAYRGADAARVDPLFARLGLEGVRGRIPKWM